MNTRYEMNLNLQNQNMTCKICTNKSYQTNKRYHNTSSFFILFISIRNLCTNETTFSRWHLSKRVVEKLCMFRIDLNWMKNRRFNLSYYSLMNAYESSMTATLIHNIWLILGSHGCLLNNNLIMNHACTLPPLMI